MPSTETNLFVAELIGLGMESSRAAKIGDILEGNVDFTDLIVNDDLSVGDDLTVSGFIAATATATATAAGTTIADALDLTAAVNNITTVASGAGVQLPAAPIGTQILVRNSGANALLVYPDGAGIKINGGTDGAAVSVAATEVGIFAKVSATNWIGGVAVVF
jgi:hypothetical protein